MAIFQNYPGDLATLLFIGARFEAPAEGRDTRKEQQGLDRVGVETCVGLGLDQAFSARRLRHTSDARAKHVARFGSATGTRHVEFLLGTTYG